MRDDDPVDLAGLLVLVLRLPAAGRVAADDGPFHERARLIGERDREALVEEPADRAADARQRLRGCGGRGAKCVEVEICPLAEAGEGHAGRVEVAARVQDERLAPIAAQLAARTELPQAAAELLVDDPGALAGEVIERLRERQCERVDVGLARKDDLDGHAHSAAMLSRLARSPDAEGAIRWPNPCRSS